MNGLQHDQNGTRYNPLNLSNEAEKLDLQNDSGMYIINNNC